MRQAQQQHQNWSFNVDESNSRCNVVSQDQHRDMPVRLDRQIQTSPSDQPAAWPPPSVHGSPRRQRAVFGDSDRGDAGGRCECSTSAKTRQPSRRDLYRWLSMAEPGARLFRAKYVYRPLRDSPNDNPETELSLMPGDYLLVFGDLDEDFYYRGELWTGERGLVPSNYVEPVTGGVLGIDTTTTQFEFPAAPLLMISNQKSRHLNRAISERLPTGISPRISGPQSIGIDRLTSLRSAKSVDTFGGVSDMQQLLPDSTSTVLSALSIFSTDDVGQTDSSCPFPVVDVSNVQVQEIRPFDGARVPCPHDLFVERQLTKSVLISWSPPVNALCPVTQYHVCVDGEVRTVVPAGYKTKALIEDVDNRKVHRISVRAISDAGQSPDEACTVTLGRGSVIRPQDLKVNSVTPVSCEVYWYPSNSSCEHLVLLNGLKVGSCPAGVYRVQIRGLIPSTMYRCAIRVKDPKAVLEEKPVESYVDFKTLPKIGLPDPPSDVNCEAGPQDGTLLVTWRPVITQPKPPSRAAVAGYLVYADGRKVCEVDSPSGDHAVLRLQELNDDPPLFITVKTKTREGAISSDSNVVRVPRTTANIFLPPSASDASKSLATCAMPTQVVKNASTQEIHLTVGASTSQNTAPTSVLTTYAASSFGQLTLTATTAADKALFSTTVAPSYYVFHPRLAPQQSYTTTVTTATTRGGASDLLVFNSQQEKPSLLEMETDYLSRHQQLQDRAAAYQSSFTRVPGASNEARILQQQALASRQAFSRRSYSLDEAPRGTYDTYGAQPTAIQMIPQQAAASAMAMGSQMAPAFQQVKQQRVATSTLNEPYQLLSGITVARTGEGTAWAESNPFRPSPQPNRFDSRTTAKPGIWPQQQDRLLAYGDYDSGTVISPYDNQGVITGAAPAVLDIRGKLSHAGALSSRHRRRLQDTAEARTLSEPDLLHYDVNKRYVIKHPPTHSHHGRRHANKAHTRLVVALYDYSPRHMSPNPNGHLDELSFRKGQLITVLGSKDADGFFRGELDGRVGLVPGNLVVEVEGGVQALMNTPSAATAPIDYEPQTSVPYGANGRYRDSGRISSRDRYYGSMARAYGESDIWEGRNGGSDPLLSRSYQRHPVREQHQMAAHATASSFDNTYDRYADQPDRYETTPGTARHRRGRYKQKSHSLEYDLDRRDQYYDQEGVPYERTSPRRMGEGDFPPDYVASSRLAARSLDRFHYHRQQPVPTRGIDPYANMPPDRRSGQPMPPVPSGRHYQAWQPVQQGYRESDQDSETELLHYHRQQQSRKPAPRRMSMFDYQQQRRQGEFYADQETPWRSEEPYAQQQPASSRQRGYDRNELSFEEQLRRGSRGYVAEGTRMVEGRKPQQSDLYYESPSDQKDLSASGGGRRADNLRRPGRQQVEPNVHDTTANIVPRRMVAKFDYDPKILSPNPDAEREELCFRAGDTILVYGEADEDGFYTGELGGRRGLIPSNYLLPEQDMMTSASQVAQVQQMGVSQQPTYEGQSTSVGSARPKKDMVSFAPIATDVAASMSGQQVQPSASGVGTSGLERKAPSQAVKPPQSTAAPLKTSPSGAPAKRQPGQLKKADSTVGQKVAQKKTSVAGGSTPGRKTSTAVSSGKGPATKSSAGQEDGAIGKVLKKIVE